MDVVINSNGEPVNISCGKQFPDSDDGPHNIYLELCGSCYTAFKKKEQAHPSPEGSVPEVIQEIRILFGDRPGSYLQYSDSINRIRLDDRSLDFTLTEEVYLEKWSRELRFLTCHEPQCKEVATIPCARSDCELWFCGKHHRSDSSCSSCEFFQTSPDATQRNRWDDLSVMPSGGSVHR